MARAEIGTKLDISETAVESLPAVLAAEGKIRVRLVERLESHSPRSWKSAPE